MNKKKLQTNKSIIKKVKRPPGRPVKYTSEFIAKEAEALLEYARNNTGIPFLQEFCPRRGYHTGIAREWANVRSNYHNPLFSAALKTFHDLQTHKIVALAMLKKIDTTMAIFTLKNVAGWRDNPAVLIDASSHLHFTLEQKREKLDLIRSAVRDGLFEAEESAEDPESAGEEAS